MKSNDTRNRWSGKHANLWIKLSEGVDRGESEYVYDAARREGGMLNRFGAVSRERK